MWLIYWLLMSFTTDVVDFVQLFFYYHLECYLLELLLIILLIGSILTDYCETDIPDLKKNQLC